MTRGEDAVGYLQSGRNQSGEWQLEEKVRDGTLREAITMENEGLGELFRHHSLWKRIPVDILGAARRSSFLFLFLSRFTAGFPALLKS